MTDIYFDTCICGSVCVDSAETVTAEITHLRVQNERLRAALDFYASWPSGPAGNIARFLLDAGAIARAALNPQRAGGGND